LPYLGIGKRNLYQDFPQKLTIAVVKILAKSLHYSFTLTLPQRGGIKKPSPLMGEGWGKGEKKGGAFLPC